MGTVIGVLLAVAFLWWRVTMWSRYFERRDAVRRARRAQARRFPPE